MKKLLLFIFTVIAFEKLQAQGVPNGGFENWDTITWNDPIGYHTTNYSTMFQQYSSGNVLRVTDAYHGNYAVQLNTTSDTSIASILSVGSNGYGIPYNQTPTGLRFYYKSNLATGDTALVSVFFKYNGSFIGFYYCFIVGTFTTYVPFEKIFSPSLSQTPDTIIFSATSGISGKSRLGDMLQIDSVTFIGVNTQPPINGDFESWNSNTFNQPIGWTTPYIGSKRTTDAYQGNYALEMKTFTDTYENNYPQAGYATTAKLINGYLVGGQPYSKPTDTIDFYYKYTPAAASGDTGYFQEDFIARGNDLLELGYPLPPQTGYTHFWAADSVGSKPDTVILTFQSSAYFNPYAYDTGSDLKIDAVSFRSQTGIKPVLLANNNILIYPNPASTRLTVASAQKAIDNIQLTTMLGQLIMEKNYAVGIAKDRQSIDISTLPAGIYFITISAGDINTTGKIAITK